MTSTHHPCLKCQTQLPPEYLSCPYCGFKIGTGEHAEAWLEETIDSKYRIDEILGIGGMGMVFKATRILLGDQIALKILFPHLLHHPLQKRLFEDEAIATAQLNHPNVITIYDAYIDPIYQIAYMAMELLDGVSFKEVMREKAPMNPLELYDPIIQICDGLYTAHSLGLVHRDLKPDNIFVTKNPDGSPLYKVLDFGIATLAGEINADEENKLLGTLRYMAPEQCLGEKVTHQTDIYALGIILYEALTRQRAVGKTVDSVLYDTITPLKQRVKNLDPSFEALIESMIAKKTEQRPKSVLEIKKTILALKNKSKQSKSVVPINQPIPMTSAVKQNTPPPFIPLSTKSQAPLPTTPADSQVNLTPLPIVQTPAIVQKSKPLIPVNPVLPTHSSFLNTNPNSQAQVYSQQVQGHLNTSPFTQSVLPNDSEIINGQYPMQSPSYPMQSSPYPMQSSPYPTQPTPAIPVVVPLHYQSSKTFGWDEAQHSPIAEFQAQYQQQATGEEGNTAEFLTPKEKVFFTFSKLLLLCILAMFLMILLKKLLA